MRPRTRFCSCVALWVTGLSPVVSAQSETRPPTSATESRAAEGAASRRPESGPADPVLQSAWTALRAKIVALKVPSEEERAAIDTEVEALTRRLELREPVIAGELNRGWADRCGPSDTAVTAYERACRLFRAGADDERLARTLTNQGVCLFRLERFDDALDSYAPAREYYKRVHNDVGLAHVAHDRGIILGSRRRFLEALEAYEEAESCYRNIGDRQRLAEILGNRGNILQDISRFPEALAAYSQAEALFREVGDETSVAHIAAARGNICHSYSKYADALALYAAAEKRFRLVRDEVSLARVALNRGVVLRSMSLNVEALLEYDKALAYYKRVGDMEGQANAAMNRGSAWTGWDTRTRRSLSTRRRLRTSSASETGFDSPRSPRTKGSST